MFFLAFINSYLVWTPFTNNKQGMISDTVLKRVQLFVLWVEDYSQKSREKNYFNNDFLNTNKKIKIGFIFICLLVKKMFIELFLT